MIVDVTGIELNPGNHGDDCIGNGLNKDLECCCDECDYLLCCASEDFLSSCVTCKELSCRWNALSEK